MNGLKTISLLLLISMIAACTPQAVSVPIDPKLNQLELGLSFPPMANQQQRSFTGKQLEALDVRRIRFAIDWRNREPEQGQYYWKPFDERMAWIAENDLSVVLTVQSVGPEWACDPELTNEKSCVYSDLEAFEAFVRTLLERYPGQIDQIQFGNEWISGFWFVGDIDAFITANNILYDVTKKVSPETEVVLGGFATGTLHALAFCEGELDYIYLGDGTYSSDRSLCEIDEVQRGYDRLNGVVENAKFDLVDLHFYDNAEDWPVEYEVIQAYFPDDMKYIVTEFGGAHLGQEHYSDPYQAERLMLYIETLDAMGIEEAYYFKLVEGGSANQYHMKSGLFTNLYLFKRKKPSFAVFQAYSTSD